MAERPVFSYGTLRDAGVQQALFGRRIEGVADALTGYRIERIAIADDEVVRVSGATHHPILRPTDAPGARIEGEALPLTATELAAADAYEGAHYVRIAVTLASGREAFVYVAA